jgi:hypothetical protein
VGFDPRAITIPVAVRYDAADTLVPATHGRWLAAHIEGALEDEGTSGHVGSIDPDEVAQHYRWLVGR